MVCVNLPVANIAQSIYPTFFSSYGHILIYTKICIAEARGSLNIESSNGPRIHRSVMPLLYQHRHPIVRKDLQSISGTLPRALRNQPSRNAMSAFLRPLCCACPHPPRYHQAPHFHIHNRLILTDLCPRQHLSILRIGAIPKKAPFA
jgi:hypothetical protein